LNSQMFDTFLIGSIGVCAIGTLLNLVMIRRRGAGAMLLALAFLLLGFAISEFRLGAPTFAVVITGLLVFALLVADFVFRLSKPRSNR
jgi:hypothetical protein